jgi:SAM-dependent methyltransferase
MRGIMRAIEGAGHYPIERRDGEIERLRMQAEAIEFDAGIMLDRIGVGWGWRCLDLGCGPGAVLALLGARVGSGGLVVGLDSDPVFLDHARRTCRAQGHCVRLVRGDVYSAPLARGHFDLVHVRFVTGTAGRTGDLLGEAIALARPGGVVAFQEPDIATLRCWPPLAAWDRLTRALEQAFACAGADVRLGQRLYQLARGAGLGDVQYRPFLVGFRASDPMADFLPATVEAVRGTIARHRLMAADQLDADLAACRRHLADPETTSTYVTVCQVWGRRDVGDAIPAAARA